MVWEQGQPFVGGDRHRGVHLLQLSVYLVSYYSCICTCIWGSSHMHVVCVHMCLCGTRKGGKELGKRRKSQLRGGGMFSVGCYIQDWFCGAADFRRLLFFPHVLLFTSMFQLPPFQGRYTQPSGSWNYQLNVLIKTLGCVRTPVSSPNLFKLLLFSSL